MDHILGVLFAFILTFCFCCFVFGWGNIINKKFNIETSCASENIIIGLFFIGGFALILNFISNISILITCVIFFLGALFLIEKKNTFIKNIKLIFIISIISTISIIYSKVYLPDAANYHLPYVSILNENKVIIGLNNINLRYGQTSILQYIASVFNLGIFNSKGVTIPIVLIFSSLIYFFLFQFLNNKSQNLKILSALILIIFLVDMNRYSEYGNDEPAHMIFFYYNFIVIKILFFNENNEHLLSDYKKILYLSLFLFMIKITYTLIFFTILFLFFTSKKKSEFFNGFNCVLLFIFIFWLIKNYLITSCLVYPIELTCISSSWNNYGYLSENILTEAWSKGFPDQNKVQSFIAYNNNFLIWFSTWSKNHLIIILEKLIPIIFIFSLVYFLINNSKTKNYKINKNYFFIFLFINILFVLIWFFFFPVYRFGSGYILFLLLLIFTPFVFKKEKFSLKKINFIIIAICIIVIGKNINRIIKNYDHEEYKAVNSLSLPLPKIKTENKKITFHPSGLFYSTHPFFCYYSKNICTSWNIKDLGNIKITKYKGYLVINFLNKPDWWKKKFDIK